MEVAGELAVEPFILADEGIGCTETRKESLLLKPEDGSKGARKEDPFNSCTCNESLCKCCRLLVAPAEGPLGFVVYAWVMGDSMEESVLFRWVHDVRVEEAAVHFIVDVFYG